MAESKTTSVIAVVHQENTAQQIRSAMDSSSDFDLIELLVDLEGLVKRLHTDQPDIMLMEYRTDQPELLELMEEIVMLMPDLAIVALLPSEDPQLAQQVMLAGVRAFLVKPFTQTNLINTMRRVQSILQRRREVAATPQRQVGKKDETVRMLTVFSPRGGVGVSTIATNLAVALREHEDTSVLLMEGKLLFGHLALMLNIRSHNSLNDLIAHAGSFDQNLVEDVVHHHSTGIDVLLAPADIEAGQGVRAQDLFNVVTGLKPLYDHIVVDGGSSINDNTVTLMDLSDRVLLLATPELAALHDISRFLELSRSLGYPRNKLMIAVNRDGMPGGIKRHDVEAALQTEPFTYIPEDEARVVRSLNRGIPMVFKYPRSQMSRSIYPLSDSIAAIGQDKARQNGRGQSLSTMIRSKLSAK